MESENHLPHQPESVTQPPPHPGSARTVCPPLNPLCHTGSHVSCRPRTSIWTDRLSFTLTVQTLRDVVILATQTPPRLQENVVHQVYAALVFQAPFVEPHHLRFNCRVVKRICT